VPAVARAGATPPSFGARGRLDRLVRATLSLPARPPGAHAGVSGCHHLRIHPPLTSALRSPLLDALPRARKETAAVQLRSKEDHL
jgi:hypothetical protein